VVATGALPAAHRPATPGAVGVDPPRPDARGARAQLGRRLESAQRGGSAYVVVLLDLDGFKRVDDTLRHQAGDELLRGIAQRLANAVGPSATVARLGGDEFAVLLAGAGPGGPLPAGGTVGFAVVRPGQSPGEVLAAADRAMYREKPGVHLRG
jgi:GGDEF domain-containing protein